MFDEASKAIRIIDFVSLIPACQKLAKVLIMLCQMRRLIILLLLIRSCGKQSNIFDRSVSNAAYSLL